MEGKVSSQDGIQLWTVPHTGTYKIETWGAQGGANYHTQRVRGGYGAYMSGEFELTKGETLRILVGQRGLDGTTDDFASCPTNQKQGAGGFGGGGAGGYTGGGGGGYSGGGAGGYDGLGGYDGAGGGGSYNAGANQSNASVVNSGHGKVVISLIER